MLNTHPHIMPNTIIFLMWLHLVSVDWIMNEYRDGIKHNQQNSNFQFISKRIIGSVRACGEFSIYNYNWHRFISFQNMFY